MINVETIQEVQFNDVDAMEVVWHGNYFKYFEIARAKLLQKIDYDYPQMKESNYLWPVIECKCRFIAPAEYGMNIRIFAEIAEWENRLFIEYKISCAKSAKKLAKGYTIQVAVNAKNKEMCLASPTFFIKKIESYL